MPSQPRSGQVTPGRSKVDFPTPDKRDTVLQDVLQANLGDYVSLISGTQHPDFVNNRDHVLLKQVPIDWDNVARVWGKDRRAQQTYNGQIDFLNDSKAHPVFTRDFLMRRSEYHEKDVKMLTYLNGLVRPTVTAPGAGYTQETVRVVLFGGVGSGGAVVAIVSAEGEVIGLQVTELGHYTIPPKIDIRDSGTGVGATGEVFIQPRDALLTKEELVRMQDDPLDALYVLVRRTYTTLPGEWIYDSRDDLLLGPVQRKRRAVAVEDPPQSASLTVTSKTTYDAREESAFVAWEIVETYSDGTGSDGNPLFPIVHRRPYDDERGPVTGTEQIVIKADQVSSLVEVDGIVTKTTYEPFDEFHYKEVIETWSNTGVLLSGRRMDDGAQGANVGVARQLVDADAATPTLTWRTLEYQDQMIDAVQKRRVVVTLDSSTGAAEVSRVTTTGSTAAELANTYFTLEDANGPVYVWFNANTTGVDPAPAGHREIEVTISMAAHEVSRVIFDGATSAGLANKYFTLADTSGAVYVWFNTNTTGIDPAPGGRGISIPITASLAEISTVSTTGATAAGLANDYFTLADAAGSVYVWFNLDAGGSDPAPVGITRGLEVAITTGETVGNIAIAIKDVLEGDAAFTATVSTNLVTITDIATGTRTNINAGTSGLTVATTMNGGTGAAMAANQIAAACRIAVEADASFGAVRYGPLGTYVKITDHATGTRTDINAGNSGLAVVVIVQGSATDSTTGDIATAIKTAVDNDASYTATVVSNVVLITDVAAGPRNDINPGTSGLTVLTVTQGFETFAFPILTEYEQHPKRQSLIARTYQVVEAAAVVIPAKVVGRLIEYRKIDKWRSLRIITIYSTPAIHIEYRNMAYHFPTLLGDYQYTDDCGTFIDAIHARSVNCRALVVHTYSTAAVEPTGELQIFTNTFNYSRFQVSDVINNANTLTFTGACSGTLSVPASDPSLTEYLAYFGTYQLVAHESVDWEAGLFENSLVYVFFPDTIRNSADFTP